MERKTKKAISFIFHLSLFAILICAYLKGSHFAAFWCMALLALIYYAAALTNHEINFSIKNLVDHYAKTVDGMNRLISEQNESIKQKDENFKKMRTKYALAKSEGLQIREMNNRLHEVNQEITRGN